MDRLKFLRPPTPVNLIPVKLVAAGKSDSRERVATVNNETLADRFTPAELEKVVKALSLTYRSGGILADWASNRQVKVALMADAGENFTAADFETAIRTLGEAYNEYGTYGLEGLPDLLLIAQRSYELYSAWLEDSLGA